MKQTFIILITLLLIACSKEMPSEHNIVFSRNDLVYYDHKQEFNFEIRNNNDFAIDSISIRFLSPSIDFDQTYHDIEANSSFIVDVSIPNHEQIDFIIKALSFK